MELIKLHILEPCLIRGRAFERDDIGEVDFEAAADAMMAGRAELVDDTQRRYFRITRVAEWREEEKECVPQARLISRAEPQAQ